MQVPFSPQLHLCRPHLLAVSLVGAQLIRPHFFVLLKPLNLGQKFLLLKPLFFGECSLLLVDPLASLVKNGLALKVSLKKKVGDFIVGVAFACKFIHGSIVHFMRTQPQIFVHRRFRVSSILDTA